MTKHDEKGPGRRGFLLGAAAALSAQAQGREVRAASIGVGVRGTQLLRQLLVQQNVKVAAICDIDPKKRDTAQSQAQRDNPKSYSEWRQVIDLKDIEAVFVATPCDLHAEMAAACLEAGKYVYCEKPLGITPEQISMVLRVAKRSKTFLQIGQQLRYYPTMIEIMRQLHDENLLGQLFVVKAQRHSTPQRPDPNRAPRPEWYLDVKRSGDLIVENAVHNIDVCNWVTRSRPVSAYGHGKKYLPSPIPAGTVMMDGFSVEYIYENDMHLDYSQLYLHPRGLKQLANNQWYVVFGEKGAVEIDSGRYYEMQSDGPPRELFTPEMKKAGENAMTDFFNCIRENRKPFADIQVGAVAALTAIMGREAIYKRRMVTWKELGVEV